MYSILLFLLGLRLYMRTARSLCGVCHGHSASKLRVHTVQQRPEQSRIPDARSLGFVQRCIVRLPARGIASGDRVLLLAR